MAADKCQDCTDCPLACGSVNGFDVVSSSQELRAVLDEIFDERFMRKYTRFEGFEAFRYSSAVIVNWDSDVLIYARERLDSFVRESTTFSTWDEMVIQAAQERFRIDV